MLFLLSYAGFEVLLPKNERIPCLSTKYFEVDARQKIVRLELREGEDQGVGACRDH